MNRYQTALLLLFIPVFGLSQNTGMNALYMLKQKNMARWEVPKGNYSGITHIRGDRYAMVSDKESGGDFHCFDISIDSIKGKIKDIRMVSQPGKREAGQAPADMEDVAYVPRYQTVFIADEGRQEIKEYRTDGQPTGRQLLIPQHLSVDSIYPNYGFESLTFSEKDHQLWTVTEHTLRHDGKLSSAANKEGCLLRLHSFDAATCQPVTFHYYRTDAPTAKKRGRNYAFGVSAITAMNDGSMLVMERELYVSKKYLGSWVKIKIYRVDKQRKNIDGCLHKELVASFKNRLNVFRHNIANYEGMCLGPRLADGRQTILLVSDSQNNYGNKLFHLKDYIRILLIDDAR